jgi:hypothetical protein
VLAVPSSEPENETVTSVEVDDPPLRWYVIAAFMAAVVAGFAIAAWFTAAWFGSCDDGRHTQPYVARDSLRGTLCDSGHGAAGLLIPGAWLLGVGLATFGLARWGGGRARTLLFAVLFVTPMALPPAAYATLRLSSTTCSDEKMQAYHAWVDDGSKGTPPYDCRTF